MTRTEQAGDFILTRMKNELNGHMHYHNVAHVLDVLHAAEEIGRRENISEKEMELLRVAVLFHDAGFIISQHDHEACSCEMARAHLPGFGFTSEEIESVCTLIMATQVPQQPQTHLEEIICDADLDYLGRDDFFSIGYNMFREFIDRKVVSSEREWNEMQVKFLSSHRYFTRTSQERRGPKKQEHLRQIKELLQRTA